MFPPDPHVCKVCVDVFALDGVNFIVINTENILNAVDDIDSNVALGIIKLSILPLLML